MTRHTVLLFVITLVLAAPLVQAQEVGINRPGSDLGPGFELAQDDPNLCKKACETDPKCKAYTYVRPGYQGRTARCWLKFAVPAPVKSDCCVSGVREIGVGAQLPSTAGVAQLSPSATAVLDLTRSRHINAIDMDAILIHPTDLYLAWLKLLIMDPLNSPAGHKMLSDANTQLRELQARQEDKEIEAMEAEKAAAEKQRALQRALPYIAGTVLAIQVAWRVLTEQERQLIMLGGVKELPFGVIAKRLGLSNAEEAKQLFEKAVGKFRDLVFYFAALLMGEPDLYQPENLDRGANKRPSQKEGVEFP